VDGNKSPTPAELTIMIAGAVMLVASFLNFSYKTSAWGTGLFPLATLLPLYGTVMALQIGLTKFAGVKLPDSVVGFSWEQVHLVLGILAGFMAIGWLITDVTQKGIGLWLEVLGGIALAVGAVMMQRERQTGAIG
jgi:predicted MFS family arabinose efflux permease